MRSSNSGGKQKWTTYEMWQRLDTASTQPAMLVSTFSATHQRQLEDQLEKAREQLLRQVPCPAFIIKLQDGP